jgi:hypothetical protein
MPIIIIIIIIVLSPSVLLSTCLHSFTHMDEDTSPTAATAAAAPTQLRSKRAIQRSRRRKALRARQPSIIVPSRLTADAPTPLAGTRAASAPAPTASRQHRHRLDDAEDDDDDDDDDDDEEGDRHGSAKKRTRAATAGALTSEEMTARQDALAYLRQWSGQRAQWKFRKVRQMWLLRHALDAVALPAAEFRVLIDYVAGMRGLARSATKTAMKRAVDDYERSAAAAVAPDAKQRKKSAVASADADGDGSGDDEAESKKLAQEQEAARLRYQRARKLLAALAQAPPTT